MELDPVRVHAKITLLAAGQGGRTQSVVGGLSYRPNFNFWPDNPQKWMAIGIIDLPEGDGLALGETKQVQITFLTWPELKDEIKPDRAWVIQEGNKVVGSGQILKIIKAAQAH
jgi:translation elongation factor EF-Tu-like GTPase